ncbi:MAG TPA: NAD(P)H-dependent oxidoreductase subunit E, partial [Acidobacteriota bacterium]|nr:NAD(P)H-dependent oxidoreductase subunit E [Acidobacteriota bacterium]
MTKEAFQAKIQEICRRYEPGPVRLLDILREVQASFGWISDDAIDEIARTLRMPRVEVESTASFYAFLSCRPVGRVAIRLCDDIIDRMHGMERIQRAFEGELGIR